MKEYKPGIGLKNPHLQTILPVYFSKKKSFPHQHERFELPCGDYLDGIWTDKSAKRPTVILIHGLGGSSNSHYINSLMHAIYYQTNWNAMAINLRGCGNEPQRTFVQYHGGDTDDIEFIAKIIKQRHRDMPLAMVGYSLGGNLLLKLFGKMRTQNIFDTGVAISPPFDIEKTANKMKNGIASLYEKAFIKELKLAILNKYPNDNKTSLQKKLANIHNLSSLDETFTAPSRGYQSVEEYYHDASCKNFLSGIQRSTLTIIAKDDPIIDYNDIPDQLFHNPNINLECYSHGGHIGFLTGSILNPSTWLNDRILVHLSEYLPLDIHSDYLAD